MLNRAPQKALLKGIEKRMKSKYVNIPIFVPHKGCPNDCSFCNQRKITGRTEPMTSENAENIIEEYLKTIDKSVTNIQIAFFGGSFTGIPKDEQKALLKVASKYVKSGQVSGIRLSTRPDYIDEDILVFLKKYGVKTIELGVQSMVDDVLEKNDRGHTALDAENASHLIKEHGFELGLQMMTGLYGDDRNGAIYTAKRIIELKPTCVRIYPTLIIKETKLEVLYRLGEYQPMSLNETVSLCAELSEMFENAGIKVLRIGLLGTDNINDESDVVAGPFHQSIGELAESERFYIKLSSELIKHDEKNIEVHVNPRYISVAVGHRKKNVLRFKEKYKNNNIKIIQNDNVPYGSFIIK